MKMFSLHLGQLADVVPFAGVEDEKQTGERNERKRAKHAAGE